MKYYLDTEFIECAKQRTLLGFKIGPSVPTIDLISLGMVCQDGRELHLLNAECELEYAWANEWVRENVLLPIWHRYTPSAMKYHNVNPFSLAAMRRIFKENGLSKQAITGELCAFVFPLQFLADELNKVLTVKGCDVDGSFVRGPGVGEYYDRKEAIEWLQYLKAPFEPSFYGYYCDYDWVVLCQLFGRMIDLPKGFPMYCLDLKQMMYERNLSKEWKQRVCPDPVGEHDALVDAKWNKQLHENTQAHNPSDK